MFTHPKVRYTRIACLTYLFILSMLLTYGCLRGGACRNDSSCTQGKVCREGECLDPKDFLAQGSNCRYAFECQSNVCEQGQCKPTRLYDEGIVPEPSNEPSSEPEEEPSEDAGNNPKEALPETQDCLKPGCLVWSYSFGGPGADSGMSIKVDTQDNVYVVGFTQGGLQFNNKPLLNLGRDDGFAAVFDNEGTPLYATTIGGSQSDAMRAVAVGPGPVMYVGGAFRELLDFPAIGIHRTARRDDDNAIVAQLSNPLEQGSKTWKWVQQAGSSNRGESLDFIEVDKEGNVYVASTYLATINIGTSRLPAIHGADQDFFVAKYKSDGTFLWAKSFGGKDDDRVYGMRASPQGGVLVSFHYRNSTTIGRFQLPYEGKDRTSDFGLAHINGQGDVTWARRIGGSTRPIGLYFDVGPKGNIVVATGGSTSLSIGEKKIPEAEPEKPVKMGFVAWLKPNGEVIWVRSFESFADTPYSLTISPQGIITMAYDGNGEAKMGTLPRIKFATRNVLLTQLDQEGNWLRQQHLQSPGSVRVTGLTSTSKGHLVLTGSFAESLILPPSKHNPEPLKPKGLQDIFVLQIR